MTPAVLAPGHDITVVYESVVASSGPVTAGDIARGAGIPGSRCKVLMVQLYRIGLLTWIRSRGTSDRFRIGFDPALPKMAPTDRLRQIVLNVLSRGAWMKPSEIVRATGLAPSVVRRALRELSSDIDAKVEDGPLFKARFDRTSDPPNELQKGSGKILDCAGYGACLTRFNRRHGDKAVDRHCPTGCIGFQIIGRESLLRAATEPRQTQWSATAY
jgi:hypothetical protein